MKTFKEENHFANFQVFFMTNARLFGEKFMNSFYLQPRYNVLR